MTEAQEWAGRLTKLIEDYGTLPAVVKPKHILLYIDLDPEIDKDNLVTQAVIDLIVTLEKSWEHKQ